MRVGTYRVFQRHYEGLSIIKEEPNKESSDLGNLRSNARVKGHGIVSLTKTEVAARSKYIDLKSLEKAFNKPVSPDQSLTGSETLKAIGEKYGCQRYGIQLEDARRLLQSVVDETGPHALNL